MKMTKSKTLVAAVVSIAALCVTAAPVAAQNIYRAVVSTVSIVTNHTGGLSYKGYGNREIIRQCANEMGLTNLQDLRLVYDRTADGLEVVTGTNHTILCTPLVFGGGVSLSKTNNQVVERLAFVFTDTNQVVNGTLRATEHFVFGPSNEITHFGLQGSLAFAVPAEGTNGAAIYSGRVSAGSFESEDEHDRR